MTTSSAAPRRSPSPAPENAAALPELGVAFAYGLDAAEGREPGHAVRVAYLATRLAEHMGYNEDETRAAFYAGLLHDVGVPKAVIGLKGVTSVDEELLFGFSPFDDFKAAEIPTAERELARRVLSDHVGDATAFLSNAWFPDATHPAVAYSHENWDASGYPRGATGDEIPPIARVLRAADIFECAVSSESNPLVARARARSMAREWAGSLIQPEVADALSQLANDDDFWLGFYDDGMADTLVASAPANGVQPSQMLLRSFSHAVGEIVDAKAGYAPGRAKRVAHYVRAMASALGMSPEHQETLAIAALWNDVGTLGVPNRILVKPDLLSVDEMRRMRSHAAFSGEIVARIEALRSAAAWVGAHHERVDGKGYPDELSAGQISTEAGILSIADAYVAITSDRPYRAALANREALAMLEAGSSTQWDPFLVKVMMDVLAAENAIVE